MNYDWSAQNDERVGNEFVDSAHCIDFVSIFWSASCVVSIECFYVDRWLYTVHLSFVDYKWPANRYIRCWLLISIKYLIFWIILKVVGLLCKQFGLCASQCARRLVWNVCANASALCTENRSNWQILEQNKFLIYRASIIRGSGENRN